MGKGKGRKRDGFVLVATAVSAVCVVALLGLGLDMGRLYATKNELQIYSDAGAVNAALQLDGTSNGITAARLGAANTGNSLKFNASVPTVTVDFATSLAGPWETNPVSASNYTYVRVLAQTTVASYFTPIVGAAGTGTVNTLSVAAQVPKTSFSEGLFPFSPYEVSNLAPDYGFTSGQLYTLRWPANPDLGKGNSGHGNVCPGETQGTVNLSNAAGGSERGYIEDTSASLIAATIIDDYQSVTRTIGDLVTMTGGAKQSQLGSLNVRIMQDSDTTSLSYANYVAQGTGNGRRLVVVPVNDGGTPAGVNNRIVALAAFFLLPTGQYGNGGGQCWCAEYIGPWVQGSRHRGAGTGGAYVVRLVG
jgi:Putative Flp pilus-assembly TadE/G-like